MGHRGPVLGTGDRTIPRAQRPAAWVWVMGGLGGNEEQPSKQSLGGLGEGEVGYMCSGCISLYHDSGVKHDSL